MNKKKTESGQVLILVAIGLISLLGFAGLAIDGGRVFSERRKIQNVADTSALAGALKIGRTNYNDIGVGLGLAEEAAYRRAEDNGYPMYSPATGLQQVVVTIQEEGGGSPFYLVKVEIISEIVPTFIQLVYNGNLTTKVEAVARVYPMMPLGYGYSMMALATDVCNAFKLSGDSNIDIKGSGIYSNSTCSTCPSGSITISGSTSIDLEGNEVASPGSVCGAFDIGEAGWDTDRLDDDPPSPVMNTPQVPVIEIPEPDCGAWDGETYDKPYTDPSDSSRSIIPVGHNASVQFHSPTTTFVFEPGMHCLYNGLKSTAGTIIGEGVMLYVVYGNVDLNGGLFDLSAAQTGEIVDDSGNDWGGMLIYIKKSSPDLLSISADEGSVFSGTVYAPKPPGNLNTPKCTFNGNGGTVGHNLQFICYTVELTGNSGFNVNYDESKIFFPAVSIDLIE